MIARIANAVLGVFVPAPDAVVPLPIDLQMAKIELDTFMDRHAVLIAKARLANRQTEELLQQIKRRGHAAA